MNIMGCENMKDLGITDYTCNGKCSSCGQCCGDILHLSHREIKRIKEYVKKNKIEATPKSIFYIDNTCPFRDNENKKCKIYEVRPDICREFICNLKNEDIYRNRERNNTIKLPRSMRQLFYKDKENAVVMSNYLIYQIYDEHDKPIK